MIASIDTLDIYISDNNLFFQNVRYPIKNQKEEIIDDLKYFIVTIKDGAIFYFVNNKLHRENDLPAIEWEDGSKIWAINNQIHRNNNNPAIIWSFGKSEYYWKNKPTTKSNLEKKVLKKIIQNF
jgi:hypothetical protein